MSMMWKICVCVRLSECERVVACLNNILSKKTNKSIYDSLMFILFPEDENTTRHTRWMTYDFYSRDTFEYEWESTKGKPWLIAFVSVITVQSSFIINYYNSVKSLTASVSSKIFLLSECPSITHPQPTSLIIAGLKYKIYDNFNSKAYRLSSL